MRISDWSSDVCSSDLKSLSGQDKATANGYYKEATELARKSATAAPTDAVSKNLLLSALIGLSQTSEDKAVRDEAVAMGKTMMADGTIDAVNKPSIEIMTGRSEEHTSELQSLMRNSYAVFCLKNKNTTTQI